MKYAFLALIACYLLVYGCGPDNSKKTEAKKEQAVHNTVEKSAQPAQPMQAAQPPETGKQPVAAAVEKTPQPAQQEAAIAMPPSQAIADKASQPPPVVATEPKIGEATLVHQTPCPMMIQQHGAVELTQPDEENIVVMPCGCMFIKHQISTNAPCLKNAPCARLHIPPCPMTGEKQPATEEDLIMMPCGRVFIRQPMPVDGADLEQPVQMESPCLVQGQTQDMEEPEEDLAGAVQRMAEATNDMLQVTKQLVVATQEMLKATKGAGSENVNANKQNLQTEQAGQSTRQAAVTGLKTQPADKEQDAMNAMKDAVIATQKAIDAMNQTVPKTLDQRQ